MSELVRNGFTDPVAERLVAHARGQQPVYELGPGNWLVAGHPEAEHALSAPELVHDERTRPGYTPHDEGYWYEHAREFFVLRNDPDHSALRSGFAPMFAPPEIRAHEFELGRDVARHVAGAADRLRDGEQVDLVPISCRITIDAIARFLGLGTDTADEIERWTNDLAAAVATGQDPSTMTAAVADGHASDMFSLVDDIIAGDQRFHDIVRAQSFGHLADAGLLAPSELRSALAFLVVGGHETPTNLINAFLLELLNNSPVRDELREEPLRFEPAVDEALRLYTPAQALVRYASVDTAVGGRSIGAGHRLTVFVPAANRDARVFEDPDAFRLDRGRNRHVTFSRGPYRCLGKHLTRVTTRYVAQAFVPLMHDLQLEVTAPVRWAPRLSSRGLVSLEVRAAC